MGSDEGIRRIEESDRFVTAKGRKREERVPLTL
jgi:hypothetical protein